jgi:hypothetical protein
LRPRAEPVAAPVPDPRFDAIGGLRVVDTMASRLRYTRRQLIVSFVVFNAVVWSALMWWLLR